MVAQRLQEAPEHLHGLAPPIREHAKLEVFAFREGFYNTRRMHSTVDYLSSDQFEEQHRSKAA